jgi:protein O-GlcNAc transferase
MIGEWIAIAALALAAGEDGRALLERGEIDRAIRAFDDVLSQRPDDLDALVGLARARLAAGALDDAEAAAARAATIAPDAAEPRLVLGLVAIARAEALRDSELAEPRAGAIRSLHADARRSLEAAVERDPALVEAWTRLGDVRLELDDDAGSAAAYASAVAAAPADVDARLRLAEISLRRRDPAAAERELRAALALEPDRLDARRRLAEALVAEGREADALAECRRILAISPADAETWSTIWSLHGAKREWDAAASVCEEILVSNGESAWARFQLGWVRLSASDTARAIAEFQRALDLDPSLDAVDRLLGDCFVARGALDVATAHYVSAIRTNPRNDEALAGLATVAREHAAQKRYEAAAGALRRAIECRPDDALLHANLGLALADLGRTDDALRAYERAVELAPADSQTWNDLGLVHEARRDFEKALACYRRAREIDGNLDAIENAGALLARRGDLAAAQKAFADVLARDPKRDRSIALYSECRRAAGERTPR